MASPAEQSVATDEYGDEFIKEMDDAQINRQMGVGACALHPCLTRQATTVLEEEEKEKEKEEAVKDGELELVEHFAQNFELRDKDTAEEPKAALTPPPRAPPVLTPLPPVLTPPLPPPPPSLLSKRGGGVRASALSEGNSAAGMSVSTARLSQRRLAMEATASAVRGVERGGGGADTPTVDLVQTAVSVREVSKLIGRTVVQVSNVRRIMIVTKPNDTSLVRLTRDLALWLVERPAEGSGGQPLVVYVEDAVAQHRNFNLARVRIKSAAAQAGGLQQWTAALCARSPELFDFVVTLGGDGTVLYTSWLFQRTVPPIIAFHLGSLGFLTVFDHRHARRVLDSAMRAGVRINLRMRFTCTVYRLADAVDPQHANVLVDAADCARATGLQSTGHTKPKPSSFNGSHSFSGSHSFNGSARRATAAAHSTGGGSHARRRSSATAPGSVGSSGAEGDGDHHHQPPHSSNRSAKREKGGRHHHHKQHHHSHQNSHYHSQASIATTPGASIAPMALSLSPEPSLSPERRANGDHLESEWDDVPCAYQQRVRKVWTRDSTFQVMNEVVVDRGPSPYLAQIELYGDGNHLTTVEADGLCLATPTGSTAYSLAAGGSLVHPEIPAILVTPICAHTLSFRPMLLPDSMVVRVVLPPDSRNTAWASFDGRHRIELRRGDHIQITASKYPLPTVCASQSQTQDWMSSLSRCLNWNERKRQKKFGGDVAASATSDDDNDNKGDDEDNNDDRGDDDDGDDDEDDNDDGMLSF